MPFSETLLQLAGAAILLVYSARMVRTGFTRAFSASFRNVLLGDKRPLPIQIFSGMLIAIMLQSSTAVILLIAGFVGTGVLTSVVALAVVLGADLGAAIAALILSSDLKILIPILLLIGGVLFLGFKGHLIRQLGRITLGIAFILLALKMISEAAAPLHESRLLAEISASLANDVITSMLCGMMITVLFHSSVAAILFFSQFVGQGLIPVEGGFFIILGANIGGGLIALWLNWGQEPPVQRLVIANLLFRTGGAALAAVMIVLFSPSFEFLALAEDRRLILFHVVFNSALVLLCFPLLHPATRLTELLITNKPPPTPSVKPASALVRTILDNPEGALTNVTRELLRMSALVQGMFRPVMALFIVPNSTFAKKIIATDHDVNHINAEIKRYIAEISRRELTSEQARRCIELTEFSINLERVGDIVAKELLPLSERLAVEKLRFSDEGLKELSHLHERVMINMQLASNVLISEDLDSARQLIEKKEHMRRLERESHDHHLERLRVGNQQSFATSDIHLEIVRALKEINSRYSTFAYPVLAKYGVLLDSRLTKNTADPVSQKKTATL